MDPRLVSHGAAFWGWSQDESEALLTHAIHNQTENKSFFSRTSQPFNQVDNLHSPSISGHDEASESETDLMQENHALSKESTTCVFFDHHARIVAKEEKSQRKKGIKEYKAFMSSTPAKILSSWTEDSMKEDKAKVDEEKMLSLQDKELEDLLESSKLIEEYASEELVGKSRRHYQMQKLVELGMKPLKKQPVEQKTKMQILKREQKADAKARVLARHMGLHAAQPDSTLRFLAGRYANSTRTKPTAAISFAAMRCGAGRSRARDGPAAVNARRDRGISGSIGRFKDGMLRLRKQDIRNVQRLGKQEGGGKRGKVGRKTQRA